MPLGIASLFVLFILAVSEKAKDFGAMNIVMLTNTYAPHVGGVARSVEAFTKTYRRHGCRVLVVAPVFPSP